jgi:hypothetical protein
MRPKVTPEQRARLRAVRTEQNTRQIVRILNELVVLHGWDTARLEREVRVAVGQESQDQPVIHPRPH